MKTGHDRDRPDCWRAHASTAALLLAACGPVPDSNGDGAAVEVQSFGKIQQSVVVSDPSEEADSEDAFELALAEALTPTEVLQGSKGPEMFDTQDPPRVPCSECRDIFVRRAGESILVDTAREFLLERVCVSMDPIDDRQLESISPSLQREAGSSGDRVQRTTFALPSLEPGVELPSALLWGRSEAGAERRLYYAYFDGRNTQRLGDADE